jgi:hypothetical protein
MRYLFSGTKANYYLSEDKISQVRELAQARFNGRFTMDDWTPDQTAFFCRTIVFPVQDNVKKKTLYMPLRDLVSLPVARVMAKHDKGEYDRYITDRSARYFVRAKSNPREPIKVDLIRNSERLALNDTSEVHFNEHQRKAKWINSMMRQTSDDSYIDKLIMENEESFTIYFHKTNEDAKVKLATYDRKIVPFFESQERFELHCPRERYAFNKQFLLIRDLRCSHFSIAAGTR